MSTVTHTYATRGAAAALERLTASVDWVLCRVCILLFMVILVTMVLQIFFRYVLSAPLTWTEELARYLYIWACWLGAPVALRRGNHVAISVLTERFPRRLGQGFALITQMVALFFLLELTYQGMILAVRSHTVRAITLPIPWSMIYLAAPVSAAAMILETTGAIRRLFVPPARENQT